MAVQTVVLKVDSMDASLVDLTVGEMVVLMADWSVVSMVELLVVSKVD